MSIEQRLKDIERSIRGRAARGIAVPRSRVPFDRDLFAEKLFGVLSRDGKATAAQTNDTITTWRAELAREAKVAR